MAVPYALPTQAMDPNAFVDFCHLKLGVAQGSVLKDVDAWLQEDYGSGDVTLTSGFPAGKIMHMFIIAKEAFTLCGLQVMAQVFRTTCGADVQLRSAFKDGDSVQPGDIVLAGIGSATGFLLGERVALNFGCRLSGVSTQTKTVSDKFKSHAAGATVPILLETRKTTPGHRIYEKYATRVGGAHNHRHGLDSGAMLKENHLRSHGDMTRAIQITKKNLPSLCKLEVEVSNLEEFQTALLLGADVIMLDNFEISDVHAAVKMRAALQSSVKLEMSGNLDTKNLSELLTTGVDFLSMGALIHKAVWVDMSLQLYPQS